MQDATTWDWTFEGKERKAEEMAEWWLRVPLHNVPLPTDSDVQDIQLRPRLPWYEARKAIEDAKHKGRPFVPTADAIVEVGASDQRPDNPWDDLERCGFWDLRDALQFMLQRDIPACHVYLHQTPDCSDEGIGPSSRLTISMVPYASHIQVLGWAECLRDATRAWANDDLDARTDFRYAAKFQHVAKIPTIPLESMFIQQWIAFELLFNRWCEVEPDAPRDLKISEGTVRREVRPAIEQALRPLVNSGHITEVEAEALVCDVRPKVFERAQVKAVAFLDSLRIDDVPADWLRWCIRIRNTLVHGRSWRELYADERGDVEDPLVDMSTRVQQTRMLVNRAIMSFFGYEPEGWHFNQVRPGRYRRAGQVLGMRTEESSECRDTTHGKRRTHRSVRATERRRATANGRRM
ncbi:MAG: hypothetical protein U9R79_11890 [Armatimonadota bacterium]|nr:hypothetical protein [Armatimonadota bacterium]